jgi:hypothetical protein
VIGVDCGNAGWRNVTCGPGYAGLNITYTCPGGDLAPVCGYWNTTTQAWGTAGCIAIAVSDSVITWACSHLTDFGARFVALTVQQNELFARWPALGERASWSPQVVALVLAIIGAYVTLLIVGAALDARAARALKRNAGPLNTQREVSAWAAHSAAADRRRSSVGSLASVCSEQTTGSLNSFSLAGAGAVPSELVAKAFGTWPLKNDNSGA